ncbi:hypothetical protein CDD81_4653 [Ophiocordyceps australis]|uniref:Uncharacterized protein n=1 Tax=Ophiocordyceps australis TaxID=1399860 RepID=A0A2C5YAZ6_9HYPO|nr:hypothetical protein CDD81_4653 [Ophiocordyceps australis]
MAALPQTTPAPASALVRPPPTSPAFKPPQRCQLPKLRLEIRDLDHAGAKRFLSTVNPSDCLSTAAASVARLLYPDRFNIPCYASTTTSTPTAASSPSPLPPPTRSVTLILRDMPGVAHTVSSDLDHDHKQIHLSLSYIASIPLDRAAAEIAGVVTHELVHCLQHNALGTCPSGLIEGVADWVRLRADLAPPHWRRQPHRRPDSHSHHGDHDAPCWDAGYQTTAFFLDYLQHRFGHDFVPRLNNHLHSCTYQESPFWLHLTQSSVNHLWNEYQDTLKCQKVNDPPSGQQ